MNKWAVILKFGSVPIVLSTILTDKSKPRENDLTEVFSHAWVSSNQ